MEGDDRVERKKWKGFQQDIIDAAIDQLTSGVTVCRSAIMCVCVCLLVADTFNTCDTPRLWGVYILKFRKIFSFRGPRPNPCTDGGEIWRKRVDLWCIGATYRPLHPHPRPRLSNLNAGVCDACMILPVYIVKYSFSSSLRCLNTMILGS